MKHSTEKVLAINAISDVGSNYKNERHTPVLPFLWCKLIKHAMDCTSFTKKLWKQTNTLIHEGKTRRTNEKVIWFSVFSRAVFLVFDSSIKHTVFFDFQGYVYPIPSAYNNKNHVTNQLTKFYSCLAKCVIHNTVATVFA